MARTLIRGGLVIDGSGNKPFHSDVLVEDDRIIDIRPGIPEGNGDLLLDASDRAVAPGFVDIHTHLDAQVFFDPMLAPSCFHGVTSAIGGNCGFSLAPFSSETRSMVLCMLRDLEDMPIETLEIAVPPSANSFAEYLLAFEAQRPMLNFGSFIGHSTVRLAVMGHDHAREASANEIERMKLVVEMALKEGALGFATKTMRGSRPSPSQFASHEETMELLRLLKTYGGVAMFNAGGAFDLEQVYACQAEIGVPFTWIAMLALKSGSHHRQLALHREWWAKGANVRPQVSCRPLVAQCNMRMPSILRSNTLAPLNNETDEARIAAYGDTKWRARTRQDFRGSNGQPIDWQDIVILESPSAPHAQGDTLALYARKIAVEPFDALFDLAVADRLETRIEARYGNTDKAEVAQLLNVEGAVFGLSDAGAHPAQTCDAVLPTDLLGNWVREYGALSLETAIKKLTSEPAGMMGIKGRGQLKKGNFADIVIFDPATVGPGPIHLCHDLPGKQSRLLGDRPSGMHHIMINGLITRLNEQSEYVPAGRILRRGNH